ncbi:MAG: MgtC/SapB family protein [Verrucomicrobiota bacterium]
MELDPLLQALIVSASLGSLIGLERQWKIQHASPEPDGAMGMRTFTLWSVFGALSAYVSTQFVAAFYPIAFGAIMALLILSYVFDTERRGRFGFTTITVALLTFVIGSLVYWQQTKVAVISTICIIILMASKHPIHEWTMRFTAKDVTIALQFAAITGVILPLVPNQAFGPFEAFNPFTIWLMVVLVAGLGFVGYVAMRLLGTQKGIGVTGLVGGMVSSTATALAFSRQSRTQPKLAKGLALAIVLAGTVMLGRVLVLTLITNASVMSKLLAPLLLVALPGIWMGLRWWHPSKESSSDALESKIINPLSFRIALHFAIAYAMIMFIVRAAAFYFKDSGVFIVSFLSGFTNVSAIVLSLCQMASEQQIQAVVAAKGIILAILAAVLFKISVVVLIGSKEMRRSVITVFGISILIGALIWPLIR